MPHDFDKIPETEWAYLAGIIDGEGCISVTVTTGGAYALQLRISQKNKEDLLNLGNKYGGHLYPKNREKAVQLEWSGRETEIILRKIFPYLKWKRDEAELAIAFASQVMVGYGKRQDKVLGRFIKEELSALKEVRYA